MPFWKGKPPLPSRQLHTHGPPGYSGSSFPGTPRLPPPQPGATKARWHPCLGRIPPAGRRLCSRSAGIPPATRRPVPRTGFGELPRGAVGAADPRGLVGQPEREGRGARPLEGVTQGPGHRKQGQAAGSEGVEPSTMGNSSSPKPEPRVLAVIPRRYRPVLWGLCPALGQGVHG